MTYRLPPLNALRAFEAAARHLSFKQAAAELHVTPGAISQQVKSLEDILGVRLFDRIHNGLMLTVEGQQYLTPLRSAFINISTATEMVAPRAGGDAVLTVGTEPEFAIKWLVPKMPAFQRQHPDLRIRIGEATSPDAIVQGDVDLAILPGISSYAALRCELLIEEAMSPVCSPDIAVTAETPLEDCVLLVSDDESYWDAWLRAVGGPPRERLELVTFAERGTALRAARAGQGLAMGSSLQEARDLEEGTLLRPYPGADLIGTSYYLIVPPGRADCPGEGAFIHWLREAVQAPTATQQSGQQSGESAA